MRKRALAAAVLVAGAITVAVPALGAAAERWTITAPGMSARAGGPVAEVALDQAGKLSLGVRRGATTVLEPSALGLEAAHADFTTGLELTGLTQRVVSERYTTVTGRRTQHSLDASELTLKLTSASQQPFELVVREASEFRVPGDADSFLLPYDNGRGDYESAHVHAKLSAQARLSTATPRCSTSATAGWPSWSPMWTAGTAARG
ncbi:glycoside hydrolase family 97 N-terminal domain-containing protein [Amycolatopsis sp. 195334CR]|uniref:glycoside hydrolase family 97 N-terminal domain-containing protein n=1 Tax=Amycolatopsis sp. 195334CR TaxID=2814588 RepID=UPI001F5DE79F|nr:glycoside hydrolase family 97 N-terminal domain-containing protein [Amycolatopsis sp. 195334CR]